jgi:hypothetical protein
MGVLFDILCRGGGDTEWPIATRSVLLSCRYRDSKDHRLTQGAADRLHGASVSGGGLSANPRRCSDFDLEQIMALQTSTSQGLVR